MQNKERKTNIKEIAAQIGLSYSDGNIIDNLTGNSAIVKELENGSFKVKFSISGKERIFSSVAGLKSLSTLINIQREFGD